MYKLELAVQDWLHTTRDFTRCLDRSHSRYPGRLADHRAAYLEQIAFFHVLDDDVYSEADLSVKLAVSLISLG